jgi:predicted  nucleic acid-binding Zn-ribbon protein
MNQRINLNRKVYKKSDYLKTIDTSFNELIPPSPITEENIITVEQFFEYYNQLFFDIPKTGINSHNTLIQQSSEYVGDEQTNEEIDALVQEINSLRDQLLQSQTDLTELQQANAELAQNTLNG